MAASNDLDSSVMISSIRLIRNPNRRGATMRMNSDAVEFVSSCSLISNTYITTSTVYRGN